jgi:hypothetical protein
LVDSLLSDKVLSIEDYEEEGENGRELVLGEKGESHLQTLIQKSEQYAGADVSGDELLCKAFFTAMNEGRLSKIPETQKPWYENLFDRGFYTSLSPEWFVESQAPSSTGAEAPASQSVAPKPDSQDDPSSYEENYAESETSKSSPDAFSTERSAIELNDYEEPVVHPSKVYMYKKPSYYWGGGAVLTMLISNGMNSSLFWYLALGMAAMAGHFAFKKVQISEHGIDVSSLFGKMHIDLADIDETLLTEEDGELSELEITSAKGESLKLSHWMDDLQGAQHLLKKLKASVDS